MAKKIKRMLTITPEVDNILRETAKSHEVSLSILISWAAKNHQNWRGFAKSGEKYSKVVEDSNTEIHDNSFDLVETLREIENATDMKELRKIRLRIVEIDPQGETRAVLQDAYRAKEKQLTP